MLPADTGTVHIDGVVGSLLSIQAGVTGLLTGRENAMLLGVLTGLYAHGGPRLALDDVRERSGLGDAFEHPVSSYSQGMRARLGFAVVDRLEPHVLLLDEVHEALDHEFRRGMEERALRDRGLAAGSWWRRGTTTPSCHGCVRARCCWRTADVAARGHAGRAGDVRARMSGPLLLVDTPYLLYRAFYGLPDKIKGADGRPVNALLGTVNTILAQADEQARARWRAASAPMPRTTAPSCTRAYHAHRPPMPADLAHQWKRAPDLMRAFGWHVHEHDTLEADDVLGSLARDRGEGRRRRADRHRRPRPVPVRDRRR